MPSPAAAPAAPALVMAAFAFGEFFFSALSAAGVRSDEMRGFTGVFPAI